MLEMYLWSVGISLCLIFVIGIVNHINYKLTVVGYYCRQHDTSLCSIRVFILVLAAFVPCINIVFESIVLFDYSLATLRKFLKGLEKPLFK